MKVLCSCGEFFEYLDPYAPCTNPLCDRVATDGSMTETEARLMVGLDREYPLGVSD